MEPVGCALDRLRPRVLHGLVDLVGVMPDLGMSLAPLLDVLAAPFGLPAQLPPRVLASLPVDASTAEALIAMALLTVAVVARGRWQVAAGLLSLLLFLPGERSQRVEMHVLDMVRVMVSSFSMAIVRFSLMEVVGVRVTSGVAC